MSNEMQQLGSLELQSMQSQYQTQATAQIGASETAQTAPLQQIADQPAAPRFIFRDFASI